MTIPLKKSSYKYNFSNNSIIPGGYYIPNVHCSKDNVLKLENIQWLTREILKKFNLL